MSIGPVTDHTTKTADFLNRVRQLLEANVPGLGIYQYKGSNAQWMIDQLPKLQLPAAVIVYYGSSYYTGSPARKETTIAVFVVVNAPRLSTENVDFTLMDYVDKVIAALDWQLPMDDGHLKLEVVSDGPLDMEDPTIAVNEIEFKTKDH